MGYYTIFEENPLVLPYKTLTESDILLYNKKDVEYFLSLFPENFGFQYTIMKTIARHGYYKSLLQYQNKKNQLAFGLETIVKLLDVEIVGRFSHITKSYQYNYY